MPLPNLHSAYTLFPKGRQSRGPVRANDVRLAPLVNRRAKWSDELLMRRRAPSWYLLSISADPGLRGLEAQPSLDVRKAVAGILMQRVKMDPAAIVACRARWGAARRHASRTQSQQKQCKAVGARALFLDARCI